MIAYLKYKADKKLNEDNCIFTSGGYIVTAGSLDIDFDFNSTNIRYEVIDGIQYIYVEQGHDYIVDGDDDRELSKGLIDDLLKGRLAISNNPWIVPSSP